MTTKVTTKKATNSIKTSSLTYYRKAMKLLEDGYSGIEVIQSIGLATTLGSDIEIASHFDNPTKHHSVNDTLKRVLREWGDDIVYMTELALALNTRSWKVYDDYENETDKVKKELLENDVDYWTKKYREIDGYILDHFTHPELSYFLKMTD